MTRREDLRKLNEVAELRSKKLDEIKELLFISPNTDDQDVVGIIKWWNKIASGETSVPTELRTKVDRLFCEFHSINDANLEILDKLETLDRRGSDKH